MAKKRHLTVLQDHEPVAEEPRSIPFLLLTATASSLVALVVVAMMLGLIGEALKKSGPVIYSIVFLLGFSLAAGTGGALTAYQAPKGSPWVARAAGAVVALVVWVVSFAMQRGSDLPGLPGIGPWLGLLGVLTSAGALGAGLAFALTRSRLARQPPAPPDPG